MTGLEEPTLGEVYRILLEIRGDMVSQKTNDEVIRGLREADSVNAAAIKEVAGKADQFEKAMKVAASTRVNLWIVAGLGLAATVISRFFPTGP